MLIRITVRNFTGASFALDVDQATTVAELKQQITAAGKGKSTRPPVLSFKGHELRDTRQLHYYDIVAKDTIHICKISQFF
jgi:Ubiquitin family